MPAPSSAGVVGGRVPDPVGHQREEQKVPIQVAQRDGPTPQAEDVQHAEQQRAGTREALGEVPSHQAKRQSGQGCQRQGQRRLPRDEQQNQAGGVTNRPRGVDPIAGDDARKLVEAEQRHHREHGQEGQGRRPEHNVDKKRSQNGGG